MTEDAVSADMPEEIWAAPRNGGAFLACLTGEYPFAPHRYVRADLASPPRPAVEPVSEEEVEAAARLIAPGSWKVFDTYLADVKRTYAGKDAAYDPAALKDKAALKIARAVLEDFLAGRVT